MDGATPGEPTRLRISVLDQSPIPEGQTGGQALRNSLDLAQLADRLGYHRYWLAEHHASPMLACNAPEAMIGPVALSTQRIRVGSGGIMLPHYSPVKVAETFSLLAGLAPGRIDLGLGRAPGSDPRTAYALQRDRRQVAPDDFRDQLAELLAYIDDRVPEDFPFARLAKTLPGRPEAPDPWLLGSSPQSGIWAAELGLPYMFADFISPGHGDLTRRYIEDFRPNEVRTRPRAAVAVSAICAETDEEAERLSASWRMAIMMLHTGRLIAVPPVETALRFLEEHTGSAASGPRGRRLIAGSPATVRAGIEQVARDYAAEEVMIVAILHDHAARRRSYELIAEAFGLPARAAAAAAA